MTYRTFERWKLHVFLRVADLMVHPALLVAVQVVSLHFPVIGIPRCRLELALACRESNRGPKPPERPAGLLCAAAPSSNIGPNP